MHTQNTNYNPFVSLIIPTKNEEKYIGKLLESIINQSYPKDKFEILIFDGLSEDKTIEIVKKYKDKLNLRIFKNPKIKQVYAFNMGLEKAKGDYFIILGAHSYIEKSFIRKNIRTFLEMKEKEPRLAGVGGYHVNVYENYFGKVVALLLGSFFAGGSSYRYSKKSHFTNTVVFGLYDKKIVKDIGKFNEDFIIGQDFELNRRLNKKEYKLYFNPMIKSYYFVRSSFKKFLIQTFNYGVVKGLMVKNNYFDPRWSIPFIFLIYEILLFSKIFTSTFLFFPFVLYWVLAIGVSLRLLIKTKDTCCLFLPIMYFIFYNIVGIGFLSGLLFGKKMFR